MKKIIPLLALITLALLNYTNAQETVVFHEGFEGGSQPLGWLQEKVKGFEGLPGGAIINWQYLDGGYYDYPDHAYQGNYNAMFQLESYLGETTKLITPPIDLDGIEKPELRFAHVQKTWYFYDRGYNDILNVYYKRGTDSSWVLLKSYDEPVEDWVSRSILLPDSSKSGTYYIAFEGITNFGYGTCIDTVRIMQTGTLQEYLVSYSIQQASTDFIPTNTVNNPILKIIFKVDGNDGSLYLDSLRINSLNTDDSDLSNNGVKLYATEDSTFKDPVLISAGINFIDGIATFENIAYDFPRGVTTVWVTYDVATAANHDVHNNTLDAKVCTEGIYLNGTGYPFSDKSPEGVRLLKESIFSDDFETDLGWLLNGSFERDTPQGLGTLFRGNPDPENAYSGSNLLGTDLTSDGAYANSLTNREDSAISPTFDCFYYNDITLYFVRWLNIEFFDKCYIDLSTDNKSSWSQLWVNTGSSSIIENSWSTLNYDLDQADFKDNVNIRFGLGITDALKQYTGWNIDDFIVVGNFISKDVGITGITLPETGCGQTSSENVSAYINNYAGEATPGSVPVRYSIDGGESYVVDAYSSSIPIGGTSPLFTFAVGADLSSPGFHTIEVETVLPGDEISGNNLQSKTIFSYPSFTLPYSENFELNNGYYMAGGTNSLWQYGEPIGSLIDTAYSGLNAWGINLAGNYFNNDSSYLESPCFNFSGTDSIVFEFKCIGISENQTDGLNVLYSLDQGSSWNLIPDDNDFNWNWYTESNISELEQPGIDTTNGEWLTFRQLLPSALSNQSSVKFRFNFESNSTNRYEGFGIDDVKICEAPYDVGVETINSPVTQCELSDTTLVTVTIRNSGIVEIPSGTEIPLGIDFEGSFFTTDTLTLAGNLIPNGTVSFEFTDRLDMSAYGGYDIEVYSLLESGPYYYSAAANDTVSETISVQGIPGYNPFNNQMGGNPITDITLDAGAGYASYSWALPPPDNTATTPSWNVQEEGMHYVTVTRNSCQAVDSVQVNISAVNLTLDSIRTELEDSCERINLTTLSAAISNSSSLGFSDEDTIYFGYQINNNPVVVDSLFLSDTLSPTHPSDTVSFTFKEECDLRSPGQYTIKVFTNFLDDYNHSDDTVTTIVNTWGWPSINFAWDTLYSSQADTLTLDAGAGSAYSWNTGEVTPTIVPADSSYYYKVTVTSAFCDTDKDSVYIESHDFGVSSIISPANVCDGVASASTEIEIEISNYSDDTYPGTETVDVFYKYDSNPWQSVSPQLGSPMTASGTVIINDIAFIDATALGQHTLQVYVSSAIDANHSNDTLNIIFNTWPLPNANLAYDTILTTKADTVVLVAQPGMGSYSWTGGSTGQSLAVSDNKSGKYLVTVIDVNGCGSHKDSTFISTYNIGINSMVSPVSDCENSNAETVTIGIKNYGVDTLYPGTTIPTGYILEGNSAVNENFVLANKLSPGMTVNYSFTNKVDVSGNQIHKFTLFTQFELDAKTSNDTLIDAIKTFGYPSTEIGGNIITSQPDTVVLVAESGFYGYFWNEGTVNDTLVVTYPATKLYSITVSDINGCVTNDQLYVYTYDIAANALIQPVDQCISTSSEDVEIQIINNSKDTLLSGELINIMYNVNSGTAVNESFNLSANLYPNTTVNHTFTQKADLSNNQTYSIDLFANHPVADVNISDEIQRDVDVTAPEFNLGPNDTIYFTTATYQIVVSGIFDSYLWNVGGTGATLIVSETGTYSVTVTDNKGCIGNESIYCEKPTGIDNLIHGDGYSISYYPNPVSENLTIEFDNDITTDAIIEIINTNGQLVYRKELSNIKNSIEKIHVGPYANGIYYLRFKIKDKFYVRKLVIQ